MRKKREAIDLIDFIQTQHTIECLRCKNMEGAYMGDDVDFARELFKKGWRATPNSLYCPKCAKKHLKKQS